MEEIVRLKERLEANELRVRFLMEENRLRKLEHKTLHEEIRQLKDQVHNLRMKG